MTTVFKFKLVQKYLSRLSTILKRIERKVAIMYEFKDRGLTAYSVINNSLKQKNPYLACGMNGNCVNFRPPRWMKISFSVGCKFRVVILGLPKI